MAAQPRTTLEWQRSIAHITCIRSRMQKALAKKGVRVITRADGAYVWDSDGNRILDGMAGLWCVNVGYGRQELVDAAARQMQELPYYNSFFQTSTPSQIELGQVLAEVTPPGLESFLLYQLGFRGERHGHPPRAPLLAPAGQAEASESFIGRTMGYHGSTLAAVSLGGMPHMHALDGDPAARVRAHRRIRIGTRSAVTDRAKSTVLTSARAARREDPASSVRTTSPRSSASRCRVRAA